MASAFFPAPSFCFKVDIKGSKENEASFQEVSGLEAEMEVEEIVEGGQNNFVYRLPKRTRFKNVIFKRGFFKKNSTILEWVKKLLLKENNVLPAKIDPQNIKVTLCNEKGEKLMVWNIKKAFPVKISMSNLNAQENAIAIETIEFAFQGFTLE